MGTCLFKLFYVGIMESLNGDGRQFFNGCVSIIQQFVSQILWRADNPKFNPWPFIHHAFGFCSITWVSISK
jgi:hypothetical protein